MPTSDSRRLPVEIEKALQRTASRTLVSLLHLNDALREHVRDEQGGGISLSEINGDLRGMVARADVETPATAGSAARRVELAEYLIRRTEALFNSSN